MFGYVKLTSKLVHYKTKLWNSQKIHVLYLVNFTRKNKNFVILDKNGIT
jgi:hypothetical protein